MVYASEIDDIVEDEAEKSSSASEFDFRTQLCHQKREFHRTIISVCDH